MKAPISLGILLALELFVTGYSYATGYKLPIFLLLTAFLPVTALLFFATTCRLDDRGRLRRDTLAFRVIKFFRPEVLKEGKLYICPTFWTMVTITACFAGLLALSSVAIWTLIMEFRRIAYIVSYLALAAGYLMVGFGVTESVSVRTERYNLWFPCVFSVGAFFVVWPLACFVNFGKVTTGFTDTNFFLALKVSSIFFVAWSVTIMGVLAIIKVVDTLKGSAIPGMVKAVHYKLCPVVEFSEEHSDSLVISETASESEQDLFV